MKWQWFSLLFVPTVSILTLVFSFEFQFDTKLPVIMCGVIIYLLFGIKFLKSKSTIFSDMYTY